jgi:adenylate cyclase
MTALKLVIREADRLLHSGELIGSLELGRQRKDEPAPSTEVPCPLLPGDPARLLLAPTTENNVGRQHVLLEPLESGSVRVHNGSRIALPHDHGSISPGKTVELTPPFTLKVSSRSISILPPGDDSAEEHGVHALDEMTIGPGSLSDLSARVLRAPTLPPAQLDEMLRWLQSTIGVLQSAVGSSGFLQLAAESLVQIIGLHSGRVLLFDVEPFSIAAVFPPSLADRPWQPSQHVLRRVRQEKRTFWQQPHESATHSTSASLLNIQTLVASPLLDRHGNVIGALYGERRAEDRLPIAASSSKLEATLVELLACGVSTGLARQEHEKAALKASALFEQFFTPELTRTLARQSDLLQGRAAEKVTVLFCDVRGFSAGSEKLGPADTFAWMNDVMNELSLAVRQQAGVLVDYVGDELMAMWGAPEEQRDQEERAVAAGLAMLAALPVLNGRWEARLGCAMNIGVGINSGPAQVGNTGSTFKFKYGPLGNTVNLASRVQGLTKYLKSRLLVTAATRKQLGPGFIARRVVRTRVVNIQEPVDLYEVERSQPERAEFFRDSEAALDALEKGDFADAASRTGVLLPVHRGDGPLQLILSRASQHLMSGGVGFDPVWESPGK